VRWVTVTWRAVSGRPYSAVGIPEEIDSVRTAADADEGQGLTLLNFSAQCERFLWDRGEA